MGRVFVSHADEDKPVLASLGLIDVLVEAGHTVWLDAPEGLAPQPSLKSLAVIDRIRPNLDYTLEISRGLESADCVLILVSENYLRKIEPETYDPHFREEGRSKKGGWLRAELDHAHRSAALVWIMLDQAQPAKTGYVSNVLTRTQALRLPDPARFGALRPSLCDALTRAIAQGARSKKPACDPERARMALAMFNREDAEAQLLARFQSAPPRLKVALGAASASHDLFVDRLSAFTLPLGALRAGTGAKYHDLAVSRLSPGVRRNLSSTWQPALLRMPDGGDADDIVERIKQILAVRMNCDAADLEKRLTNAAEPVLFVLELNLKRAGRRRAEAIVDGLGDFWSAIVGGNAFMLINVIGEPALFAESPALTVNQGGALLLNLGHVAAGDVDPWLRMVCEAWDAPFAGIDDKQKQKLFPARGRAALGTVRSGLLSLLEQTLWPRRRAAPGESA